MDFDGNFVRANNLNKVFKQQSQERYNDRSKQRLSNSVYRKFRTTFIGALAEFETAFSHLWGHKKSIDDLTDDELYYRKIWEDVRTRILNNGNNQAREAETEIPEHEVEWK